VKVPYIDLVQEHRFLRSELLAAVGRVFDRADFILGAETAAFEKNIAHYCGVPYAVGVNSGTDALFLALKVLEIGPGDEVITVPNSFLATVSAIVACGARPVLVDVRDDYNINPALIALAITKKTKAIIPVHLTGKPADMRPIVELAQQHRLQIIEDCAQAIGAEYQGKKVGTFGLGCFSLHPLKNLAASGDGGFITTDNAEYYQKLTCLRNIGFKNRNECTLWGYNSRLDSVQAAILNVKLKYLDNWIQARRETAGYYTQALKKYIKVPEEKPQEKAVYHTYIIQTEKRDALQAYLAEREIETKIHYPIPIHLQEAAGSLGYKQGSFPVTEKQSATILTLPVHQYLSAEQKEYIVRTVVDFFTR
jgi:dTDP-4-amino-4,6-dideoxygalactose transaminase